MGGSAVLHWWQSLLPCQHRAMTLNMRFISCPQFGMVSSHVDVCQMVLSTIHLGFQCGMQQEAMLLQRRDLNFCSCEIQPFWHRQVACSVVQLNGVDTANWQCNHTMHSLCDTVLSGCCACSSGDPEEYSAAGMIRSANPMIIIVMPHCSCGSALQWYYGLVM